MKLKIYLWSIIFLILSISLEAKNNLATFYEVNGNIEKQYNKLVEKKLPAIGFNLADPHHRVNDQYKAKYGSTKLDVLSFLPVVNDNVVMPLFNIDPRVAGFSPFNMLIYKRLDEKITHIGHISPEAMLDIVGVKDNSVRKKFIDSFKPLDSLLDKELKGAKKVTVPFAKETKDGMFNFEYEFNRPEDLDDFVEEFQNKFENAFINKGYLIAGFFNFMDTDNGEEVLSKYDIFWSYSLCHLGYSYSIFDKENSRPDAGLFAPCTMYMFVKKDSNKLIVGMPKLANVKNSLGIKDPKRVEWMDRLDREIPQILRDFGMVAVENVNPITQTPKKLITKPQKEESNQKVENENKESNKNEIDIILPKVPIPLKVNTINGSNDILNSRQIQFSKRYPPNYTPPEDRKEIVVGKNEKIGDVNSGRISVNLLGKLIDIKEAQNKLKRAGFDILAVVPLDKKGNLISIVFTNEKLKKLASKNGREFIGTLRLLIDKKSKKIAITNPLYLSKAFLQDDFKEKEAREILGAITKEFPNLKNSLDKFKFQSLPNYQFMEGMPHYQDMVEVANGDNLIDKIKDNKNVLFIQKLDNKSILIGVKLSKRTSSFPKKIGTINAGALPYPVVISDGKAKILDPKYYISVMYPNLKMEEFMTIATIPGAIIKDCEKIFR